MLLGAVNKKRILDVTMIREEEQYKIRNTTSVQTQEGL